MRAKTMRLLAMALTVAVLGGTGEARQPAAGRPMLVIHGGAGTITRGSMTAEREKEYRAALEASLRAGHAVLARGGSSLDAVEASVRILEDHPLFNAGKGAVFTHEGRNELDASIMDGRTMRAGSVAGVTIIRNPISAARAVMERSKHVMMAGRGAELFATKMGLEVVDPSYFWTESRWKSLQRQLLRDAEQQPPRTEGLPGEGTKFGTVGAVAVDREGNLAAATSTGGMTNKQFGRVGDSPIIGAGTYAANESCAVSGTGHGEFFIRWTVSYDIAALMKYRGLSVQQAADEVINRKLKGVGGEGGVIAVDGKGNIAMPFNTEGMYRGWIGPDGVPHVAIYRD
ncbi:MAG TPA: isoaspartyl peptidase/L-asparaginase [Thermoanaerobaculia bacterium]|nr:isoaspartyl peptidase/L-asparaginase [Thermoanaerobaculia bacterium]